jgi:hypothetical protein
MMIGNFELVSAENTVVVTQHHQGCTNPGRPIVSWRVSVWVLSKELASRHPSGAWNSEVVPRFLIDLCFFGHIKGVAFDFNDFTRYAWSFNPDFEVCIGLR